MADFSNKTVTEQNEMIYDALVASATTIGAIDALTAALSTDIATIKSDVGIIKGDVSQMSLSQIEADVLEIKNNIGAEVIDPVTEAISATGIYEKLRLLSLDVKEMEDYAEARFPELLAALNSHDSNESSHYTTIRNLIIGDLAASVAGVGTNVGVVLNRVNSLREVTVQGLADLKAITSGSGRGRSHMELDR